MRKSSSSLGGCFLAIAILIGVPIGLLYCLAIMDASRPKTPQQNLITSVKPKAAVTPLPSASAVESETPPVANAEPEVRLKSKAQKPPAAFRTWTDNTGSFKVSAEFVSFGNGKVKLRKQDGNEVTVPLERLSTADVEFVRERCREHGIKPTF